MRFPKSSIQAFSGVITAVIMVLSIAGQTAAQTWTQLTPTGTPPSPRGFNGTRTAYDPASNRMIVFGGRASSGNTNDVWVLTNANGLGGAGQWINTIANGASGAPPPRSGHSIAYDPTTNRMIVFGGCNGGCLPVLNDVWVLTNANGLGGTPTWSQLNVAGGSPTARTNHSTVYDSVNNRMIVFGGQNGGGGSGSVIYTDVWVLSNANGLGGAPSWNQLTPTGGGPLGGYAATAVYDPAGNRMTVFGGAAQTSGGTNAVWVLSNANGLGGAPVWTNLIAEDAAGSPSSERSNHTAVYDPTTNQMIIFGGGLSGGARANDVWALSHANGLTGVPIWSQLSTAGGPPPARQCHGMVYDAATKRVTIFAGEDAAGLRFNDAWTLAIPARNIYVADAGAAPGSAVTVPLWLNSQGDENALGFSLTFNPAILSAPQVSLGSDAALASLNTNTSQLAQGRLGVAIALPAMQNFAPGLRRIVNVTFSIAANTQMTTTQIGFSDQPIGREVVSAGVVILPATYTPGSVTVTPGYEADVNPRPNGNNNGTVTIADWVQVGRFAAGVDTAALGSEFQRADCAPREIKGDGRISIADWVQAGRYSANIDAIVPAGGPTAPTTNLMLAENGEPLAAREQTSRTVRALNSFIESGQSGTLAIELDSLGNENAMGFSLNFDPAKLRFVSAALGNGASGALLNINTAQAANGRVGIALALNTNQTFAVGSRQLIVATFAAAANASGPTTVAVGDQPVGREVVDSAAKVLNANWTSATVTIARSVTSVSAASFTGSALAGDAIVAAFGSAMATSTQIADSLPLPTSLAGTTVRVRDSANVERLAPLFFVAPTQINYQIPPGTAAGPAAVTVASGDGETSNGNVMINTVAPGLFSADASGQGIAAGVLLRVKSDGSQRFEEIGHFDQAQNKFVATPIDLGVENDQVFLILYGTGWRYRSSLSAVTTKIGGQILDTLYAGGSPGFIGLDQLNLRLPRSLAGRGEVDIVLSVDGSSANTVRVSIK